MTAPGDPPPPAAGSRSGSSGLLHWCFAHRDTGRITIVQWPNLPAWLFIAGALVRVLLHPTGRPGQAILVFTALALAWWAVDEVIRGSNPWRRALGVAVLAGQAWYFWPR